MKQGTERALERPKNRKGGRKREREDEERG